MKVLIAVTHLLGAGHLTRAAALARAFAACGHTAVLVSGGRPAPLVRLDGVRLVQLPPLSSDGFDFGHLLGPDGRTAGPDLFEARRALLLDTLAEVAPDAVITELFPFGRRGLADEFLALIEATRARPERPLILASVRDILVVPDRPDKVDQAHRRIAALYDAVLVHGDPALVPLDASWPVDGRIAGKIAYTGYVDEGGNPPAARQRAGVLVAAGSSAAGMSLFHASIAAAERRPELGWRILVGHGVPDLELARLAADLPDGTVSRARADYRDLLASAAVSVSQCGYNTAVDLLATGTPAVLVPFEAGRETEQRLRAERLAALGHARIVPECDLTPEALILAVDAALGRGATPMSVAPMRDGGERTVEITVRLRRSRTAVDPGPRRGPAGGFAPLTAALDRASACGRSIPLWWRDDDAIAATPALDRLLALAAGTPILIAAIPAGIEPSLADRLRGVPGVAAAVHGLAHSDHAPPGEKSAEFGPHRPLAALRRDASEALRIARERLPADLLVPVFVPPWNRIAEEFAPTLPQLGYAGLSAAGGAPVPGLIRAEATLDPVDWRGTRSLRDPKSLLATLTAHAESRSGEPLGLLTHHLAHDEAIWAFLERLIPLLSRHPAVRWHDPRDLFVGTVDAPERAPISSSTEPPRAG